ncbi:MAG: AAA family ATPase, partial [Deltaproteobacteria bacterium]|nr:AAA family ATPase [Deltaproteobacteria bacterium]
MTDCGERETRRLLLTRRLYREQERVAAAFRTRAVAPLPDAALVPDLDAALLHHFPDAAGDPLRGAKAEARRAAHTAATRPLALVVGGPGTGKTFSVTRLLATLLAGATPHAAAPSGGELAIVLTAPTGKATARMREAIREATAENARASLDVSPEVRARLRDLPAETIHKLVGVRPDGSCRHHREHPLAADVVVVDEVSMVDLGLMRRLLDAVRPTARLVLLGDRDQLASVDAGCVLAELYEARDHALQGTVTTFTHSQRFAGAPDIGLVAASLQSYRTGHPDLAEHERPEERRAVAVRVMCEAEHATAEDVG